MNIDVCSYNNEFNDNVIVLLMWGFIIVFLLIGVRRGIRGVDGTFSCRFEEIGHIVSWDAILLLIGFLVFEFEILFIVLVVIDFGRLYFAGIVIIMGLEIAFNSFGY